MPASSTDARTPVGPFLRFERFKSLNSYLRAIAISLCGVMQEGPQEGSIETGEVIRIEPYGAFVQLSNFHRLRGLLHISQIAEMRLDKVEDALSMGDQVWVRVVEVARESDPDPSRPPRLKIKLSIKGVTQDGSAREQAQAAQASHQLSQSIEQNLNSTIGMGVARDPMATASGKGLILKNDPSKRTTLINGYALVDDTEGEPPAPKETPRPTLNEPVRPLGRGRGTTLPAWMTKQDGGPGARSDDSDGSRGREKKHKKKKKTKHSRKSEKRTHHSSRHHHADHSLSGSERRHKKKHKRSKRRDRSSSEERRSSKRMKKSSRSYSSDASEGSNVEFKSLAEAKRLVEKLEGKSVR